MKYKFFSYILKASILSLLLFNCTFDRLEPTIQPTCKLISVYKEETGPFETTMYHRNGFGSEAVYYYSMPGEVLINHTTYEYDSNGRVIDWKIYDSSNVLKEHAMISYWLNGNIKFENVQRENAVEYYETTDYHQELSFDEQGNIILFKNFNKNNTLMNHVVYTNEYENDLLKGRILDDQIWGLYESTEYTNNERGLKTIQIGHNINNTIKYRIEFTYNDGGHLIKQRNLSTNDGGAHYTLNDTQLITVDKYGVILKIEQTIDHANAYLSHTFNYECN